MRQKRTSVTAFIVGILIIVISNQGLAANSTDSDSEGLRIDSYINQYLDYYHLPGLAVYVIKEDKVILEKGYGVMSVEELSPVTISTVFSTASVTKLFTGTAIMQLYDAGLMDINAPVTKYLPYFRLKDPRYRSITVSQMLSHTSGMPDTDAEEFYSSWANPSYADDALETYVRSLDTIELIAEPGTEYAYSNIAYDILADVVAKCSGQSFEDYISDHILAPLKMGNSSVDLRDIKKSLLAVPHLIGSQLKFAVSDTMPYSRRHVGSGTLFSSVEDLGRFAGCVLSISNSGGKSILSDSALHMMWTPETELSDQESRGLSWLIWKEDNEILYEHSGGDPGYRCDFVLIPGISGAVIVMTNSWEHDITPVTMMAVRTLLGTYEPDCKESTRGRLWDSLVRHGADSAITLFERIKTAEGPECLHPAHLNQIGNMLMDLQRYDVACKLKEFNSNAYPNIKVIKLILADTYLQAGNKAASLRICNEILKDDPDNEGALELLDLLEN